MADDRVIYVDRTLSQKADLYSYVRTCLVGKSEFFCEMPSNIDQALSITLDVQLIAFYLPQFHRIPTNDAAWGRGFTEWANVTKASPFFFGHRQPHLPIDSGFYDLNNEEVIERQICLAKYAGVSGFCFHYYYFSGTRLLDRPIKKFLNRKDKDFKFMLCWANESWTKRWDGGNDDIIIAQEHSFEADKRFIYEIMPYLEDPAYIRTKKGLPLILYVPSLLHPHLIEVISYWRDVVRRRGLGDLYLLRSPFDGPVFAKQLLDDKAEDPFDGLVQFPPVGCSFPPLNIPQNFRFSKYFSGNVFDFADAMRVSLAEVENKANIIATVFPSWDNSSRKAEQGWICVNSNPVEYQKWLTSALKNAILMEKQMVFVNAWNEWAEAAHLEPCSWYGYAYLNATRNSILNAQS
jgi:lipopolysaccharide biosynthesis protein